MGNVCIGFLGEDEIMLEKLIYKNSWVRDWNFDVTMCREAEDFIR